MGEPSLGVIVILPSFPAVTAVTLVSLSTGRVIS
jgi:hypothetical protein